VHSLLGAGVLGDGLGSLRDGVLGELTWQEEPDSGLDFPGGDGGPLVVVGKTAGLSGDALEQVVDEGVHDAHGLGGDTGVGVHLLEDLVDVGGIRLLPQEKLPRLPAKPPRLSPRETRRRGTRRGRNLMPSTSTRSSSRCTLILVSPPRP